MRHEMTIEDATNVVNVLSDVLACDANEDLRELATAARQLVRPIAGVLQDLVIAVPRDARLACPANCGGD